MSFVGPAFRSSRLCSLRFLLASIVESFCLEIVNTWRYSRATLDSLYSQQIFGLEGGKKREGKGIVRDNRNRWRMDLYLRLIFRQSLPAAPFSSLARSLTRSFSALARSFASRSRAFCSSLFRFSRSFLDTELVDDSSPALPLPFFDDDDDGTHAGVGTGGGGGAALSDEGADPAAGADESRCLTGSAAESPVEDDEGVERPSPRPFVGGNAECEEVGRGFSERDRERNPRVRAANALDDEAPPFVRGMEGARLGEAPACPDA
jgi:hypothetical protein